MDSIITFAKNNFDLICLLVGLIGVVVGIISVIDEVRKRKSKNKEQ
jgi:hypothetical protein